MPMVDDEVQCGVAMDTSASHRSAFEISAETSLALQKIYSDFKEGRIASAEALEKIESGSDYSYIITSLYGWCKENRMFPLLVEFYKASGEGYEIKYADVADFVSRAFRKFKDPEIIRATASCLHPDDVLCLIRDFEEYDAQIAEGLIKKIKNSGCSPIFEVLVEKMVMSKVLSQESVGSRCYSALQSPKFSIDHLLSHTKDEILAESIKQLKGESFNSQLLSIIFRRGTLDYLTALALQKLDISQVDQKDLHRIYSLFHISPLNYVRFNVHKLGFSLNEHMAIDLIRDLESVFSDELFEKVSSILSGFEMTEACYNQMISSLSTSNHHFKSWVFEHLRTESIALPFFVKVCWFICNEDDLEIVKSAILVLKAGRTFDVIEKWAGMKKLERLTRRVYPLRMRDPRFYERLFVKCQCEEEKNMLRDVYGLGF